MEKNELIYKTEHRQLSRIAFYSAAFSTIPLALMLIFSAVLCGAFIGSGLLSIGIAVAFLILLGLTLNLVTKAQLNCPKCKKPFFGRFKIFLPYVKRCQTCGFHIVPKDPVHLDGQDM